MRCMYVQNVLLLTREPRGRLHMISMLCTVKVSVRAFGAVTCSWRMKMCQAVSRTSNMM